MNRYIVFILFFCFLQAKAEAISFNYDSKRDSLTFIGEGTLEQKHVKQALTKYPRTKIVYVGGNISTVGYEAFNGCNNVETIIFSSSVLGSGYAAICNCKKLSKVVLPENYKVISCFLANCPNLESFVIPDSVRVIKELSSRCPVKSLHIGKNVQDIVGDYGIFSKRLSHISVSPGNKLFFSQDGVLYTYYPEVYHYYEDSYFKSRLKKDIRIVKYPPEKRDTAFFFNYPTIGGISNKYLREIRLGSEARRWERCSVPSLSRFVVDDANDVLSVLEDVLFEKAGKCLVAYPPAKKGNRYMIPSCVEKLGSYAFVNCQFDTLVCPASIKIVHRAAICYCEKLRCVEMHWQNPNEVSFDSHPFDVINTSEVTLKVPKGTKNLYIELFNNRMGYQFNVEE
ncbi:MAG: leucine-rich repeat domain-containing protein [Paludibacteraceae bacterium]|nr:leucine-rich repeat domain-containing protein [Paludibacteraceae bacterium]